MTHLHILPLLLTCLALPAQGPGTTGPSTTDPSTAARAQLDRALGTQDPSPPAPIEDDPLLRVIVRLDLGYHHNQGSPAHGAYVELSNLGVLAAPSLYRALDALGPFGLNAALELLVSYPDQRMTTALDRLLRSNDTSRQIIAARLMARLPIEIVRPLAKVARASEIPEVRLADLAVRARDGMNDRELAAELLPLTAQTSEELRLEILRIIRERPTPGRAFLEVLEPLMHPRYDEADADPAEGAINEWARRIGDHGEAFAITLFNGLTETESRFDLLEALHDCNRHPWTKFYAHAGMELPSSRRLTLVWALAKSLPQDLPDDLLRKLLAADPAMGDFGKKALELTMMTRRPSLAVDVGLVLLTLPDISDAIEEECFEWLAEVAPEFLIENAADVLRRPAVATQAAKYFASIDDPRTVRPAAEILRRISLNSSMFEPLRSIVSYRSTGDNLDTVLDLVSHPLDESGSTEERVDGARRALNRWLAPEHLPVALDRLFDIHRAVASDILQRATEIAGPEQRPAVIALLQRCRNNWKSAGNRSGPVISTSSAGLMAIKTLRKIGGEADANVLFELLDAQHAVVREAGFLALLAMDAASRKRALTLALQRDLDPFDVLAQRDIGRDHDLRRLATNRLMARAFFPSKSVGSFLASCPEEDRVALIDGLLRQAEEHKDTVHVEEALVALGKLGREGDEAEFGKWIRHRNRKTRTVAIEQLGRTYSPDAVPFLLEALKDDYIPNRESAGGALSRFESYLNERTRWMNLLKSDPLK